MFFIPAGLDRGCSAVHDGVDWPSRGYAVFQDKNRRRSFGQRVSRSSKRLGIYGGCLAHSGCACIHRADTVVLLLRSERAIRARFPRTAIHPCGRYIGDLLALDRCGGSDRDAGHSDPPLRALGAGRPPERRTGTGKIARPDCRMTLDGARSTLLSCLLRLREPRRGGRIWTAREREEAGDQATSLPRDSVSLPSRSASEAQHNGVRPLRCQCS